MPPRYVKICLGYCRKWLPRTLKMAWHIYEIFIWMSVLIFYVLNLRAICMTNRWYEAIVLGSHKYTCVLYELHGKMHTLNSLEWNHFHVYFQQKYHFKQAQTLLAYSELISWTETMYDTNAFIVHKLPLITSIDLVRCWNFALLICWYPMFWLYQQYHIL